MGVMITVSAVPKKSEKRLQDVPFQLRMRDAERRYLETGAKALSDKSPSRVGLGPYLKWAALAETERLTGVTLEAFEKRGGRIGK
jgi:hypothetical protein